MKTRDVMNAECRYCAPGDSVVDAAKLMADEDFGAVPIAENNRLVGMLTDRDIVVRGLADGRDAAQTKIGDIMSGEIYYCYDDQDIEDVAANMGEMQVRRMPVVNRDKRLVGMVAIGDLARQAPGANVAGEALGEISRPAA
ncbi:CBS domain-containing protein [Hyphococcus luteus]|uniref:CBS domain-containing protein n=1 Tax=Hyphococcus luteus TaxID=2058213 RepID=A0A2S7K077_9PROT|nr:CBS domain-containing protein [Marinicaulis flavus]PQA85910.1 CBS domain-containing protein [Marinicaulis flavus]